MVDGLTEEQIYKIMRGNAIRMLHLDLDRDGCPPPTGAVFQPEPAPA